MTATEVPAPGWQPFVYTFGPFQLFSELELPQLALAPPPARVSALPVTIHIGTVAPPPEDCVAIDGIIFVRPHEAFLILPQVARFAVLGGQRVVVEPAAGSSPIDIRSYLTGWVFGALCLQSGFLPLHACAVASAAGEVTAFLGASGAGKSTLAAALQRLGHRVVADDICLLVPGPAGLHLAPVNHWLKLHRRSLEHLRADFSEAERTFTDEDKFRIPVAPGGTGELRLAHLVFLEQQPAAGASAELSGLAPAKALGQLMQACYLSYLCAPAGLEVQLFTQCSALLRTAEPFRVALPWGFEHLGATVALVNSRFFADP